MKEINPAFVVISGPSGSGKTTLCRMVEERLGYYYAVSHTTRPQRSGEVDGEDYFFISKDKFQEMIDEKEFLEWAEVFGNLYGTSKTVVEDRLKKGQGVIVDVDTLGARNLKKNFPEAILIFLSVESQDVLKHRLTSRGTETKEKLDQRLAMAAYEESFISKFDHNIVNKDLEESYQKICQFISRSIDNISS